MWRPTLCLAAVLAVPSQALHFFIDGAVQKCFFEELPKDTLVVGTKTHSTYPLHQEDCSNSFEQATTTPKSGTTTQKTTSQNPTWASS
jgi:hypothetical protein